MDGSCTGQLSKIIVLPHVQSVITVIGNLSFLHCIWSVIETAMICDRSIDGLIDFLPRGLTVAFEAAYSGMEDAQFSGTFSPANQVGVKVDSAIMVAVGWSKRQGHAVACYSDNLPGGVGRNFQNIVRLPDGISYFPNIEGAPDMGNPVLPGALITVAECQRNLLKQRLGVPVIGGDLVAATITHSGINVGAIHSWPM